jgi:PAS domain S-box-containing protein
MPAEFNNLPMNLDANSLIDGVEKLYTPLDTGMPNVAFASSTASIPLTTAGSSSLPADFRTQSTGPGRNTLADFTRRKDFPQRIVEELEDFLHILTPDGRIVYLSPSSSRLTGYSPEELREKFFIDFIHPDDSGIFMRDFNESLATGSPLHLFYRFWKRDGTYTIFECRGHPHFASEATAFGSNDAGLVCGGFFMMARPYPTKNAALLDSFLEHKIENERLTKRINDLKREEAEDAKEEQKVWQRKQGQSSDIPLEEINAVGGIAAAMPSPPHLTSPGAMMMLPPTQPLPMNSGRRESVEDGNTNRHTDSVAGNAAHYDGTAHIETIELLTGLNYQDGERSQGISTGDQSPILVRGDAGIAIPMIKESKSTDKKKKIKLPEDYVCTDCGMSHYLTLEDKINQIQGTLDSPEWRKGPSGPKTLCNACGLRWAKKEKRKSFSAPVPMMVYSGPR